MQIWSHLKEIKFIMAINLQSVMYITHSKFMIAVQFVHKPQLPTSWKKIATQKPTDNPVGLSY